MNNQGSLELLGKNVLPIRKALNLFFEMNKGLFQHSHTERSELLDVLMSREDWQKFPMEEKMKLLHIKEEISEGISYVYPNVFFERISKSQQWKDLPLEKAFSYIFSEMEDGERTKLKWLFLDSTLSSVQWKELSIDEAIDFADKYKWHTLMAESINRRTEPNPKKVIKKPWWQKFIEF